MESLSGKQIKNFRNQSVIKYFYKYISDHNLRQEALILLEQHRSFKKDVKEKDTEKDTDDAAYGYEDVEALL